MSVLAKLVDGVIHYKCIDGNLGSCEFNNELQSLKKSSILSTFLNTITCDQKKTSNGSPVCKYPCPNITYEHGDIPKLIVDCPRYEHTLYLANNVNCIDEE
jgi:antirestriction protein